VEEAELGIKRAEDARTYAGNVALVARWPARYAIRKEAGEVRFT
jgi:hypothetical protein